MSKELRTIIRVGVGGAVYKEGFIEIPFSCLEARSFNIDLILSMSAACFSKSIAEKLGVSFVEVSVELYEDLDALLDGDLDNANMLKVKVRGASRKSMRMLLQNAHSTLC